MKPIKIEVKNEAAIVAALKLVNGKAAEHCYTSFMEIERIASWAEFNVVRLVGTKALAVGAKVTATSGDKVSSSYSKSPRAATRVVLERRATGWFLVVCVRTEVWQEGGAADRLTLTQSQADRAVCLLKRTFNTAL